ncbi:hypothetical protein HWV62_40274 [Athelia sp. TMB]|nr:hypothetical protein HWV62_40274 [Athelia sp. TMB]
MSACAIQLVEREVIREAQTAVKPENGLHAYVTHKHRSTGTNSMHTQIDWVDIGATTVKPVTWHLFTSIAARKPRVRNGIIQERKHHPVDVIGIAATYFKIEGCQVPGPDDLADRFARVEANDIKNLTTKQLLEWLAHHKWNITILFRTRGAKHHIPLQKTKAYPLATSGKNEVVITELKDACFDFLEQLGQTKERHIPRPIFMGGDGLTYDKMSNLQKYLQNHADDFDSCRLLNPLAFGVEGDIFEYFSRLETDGTLPSFEELEEMARKLHRGYSSFRAATRAMYGTTGSNQWSKIVPMGSPWTPADMEVSSEGVGITINQSSCGKTSKTPLTSTSDPFRGDRVLARTILLIIELLLCIEMAYAVADGDAGHVYEVMKVMLFLFSGSSHTNYMNYLLKFITEFELESNQVIRDVTLSAMLVNLSGKPGHWAAGDPIQEFFNRLLEAILERKGANFGDSFIREAVSRNLHHLNRVKKDLREGLGLEAKSGRHTEPHARPEIKTLLAEYRAQELHSRRPGRSIDTEGTDDFQQGYKILSQGKLKQWVNEVVSSHVRVGAGEDMADNMQDEDADEDEGENSEVVTETEPGRTVFGTTCLVDGDLDIETFELNNVVNDYVELLQAEHGGDGDEEEDLSDEDIDRMDDEF